LKNVARLRVIEHGGDPAAVEAQTPAAPVRPAPANPPRGKRTGAAKSAGAAQ
jgi:hypothetical protein